MRLFPIPQPSPRSSGGLRRIARAALVAALTGVISHSAGAQPVYSIDWHGPPKGTASFFGIPITEGDLLVPVSAFGPPAFFPTVGPLPPVAIAVSGGFGPPAPGLALPLHPGAMGLPPGVMGMVELDAVSYGTDYPITPLDTAADVIWTFSVDEYATGIAGSPVPPNVFTEGPVGGGATAASKIFRDVATGSGPICVPIAASMGNTLLLDCNGIAPPAGGYPGIMGPPPFEFNPPVAGVPDPGADVDALDMDPPPGLGPMGTPGFAFPIYYSLDAMFFDALEAVPNSGSAGANGGFFGGDVLVCMGPGVAPAIYAPGFMLGIPGPGNDLDGLILWENGTPGYQPPTIPFSWVPGVVPVPTDMLFFSVRRGSAIVGVIDPFCGTPIMPGDILWGPPGLGAPPRKWITSGQLALVPTDDIDALDLQSDCNSNNLPDNLEVITGFASDINGNGLPDVCDCLADIDGDGDVDIDDLLAVIGGWGGGGPADVNFNGIVDIDDLLIVIGAWGPCP